MASLHLTATDVEGCFVIYGEGFSDNRGYFTESFNRNEFLKNGLPVEYPQDNISNSHQWVLRGLHIQRKNPQGKLVRCIKGTVYDVCLDLRPDSPSYLNFHMQPLSGVGMMYCPPGTAHGFIAMDPRTIVYYKCTTLYDKDSDGGINPLDPELGIPWPSKNHVISEKDKGLPSLKEWLADPRGITNA